MYVQITLLSVVKDNDISVGGVLTILLPLSALQLLACASAVSEVCLNWQSYQRCIRS